MSTRFSPTALIVVFLIVVLLALGIWWERTQVPATAPSAGTTTSVMYSCLQGKTIQATFMQGATASAPAAGQPPVPTGSVALTLSDGRSMTLPQSISGSGIRYANADGSIVFWNEGNGAFILENNQQTFMGCVAVVPDPGALPEVFANGSEGFSLRYPTGYSVQDPYTYQELGPGKDISGVKFTIATSTSEGTNLSPNTYVSVEEIPNATSTCSAALFLDASITPITVVDNGTTYLVASSTGAAAGNRYEEWVYAIPGTNPCRAVRYFIHYGVIDNYPSGSVNQFNEAALLSQFDAIRRTLTLL